MNEALPTSGTGNSVPVPASAKSTGVQKSVRFADNVVSETTVHHLPPAAASQAATTTSTSHTVRKPQYRLFRSWRSLFFGEKGIEKLKQRLQRERLGTAATADNILSVGYGQADDILKEGLLYQHSAQARYDSNEVFEENLRLFQHAARAVAELTKSQQYSLKRWQQSMEENRNLWKDAADKAADAIAKLVNFAKKMNDEKEVGNGRAAALASYDAGLTVALDALAFYETHTSATNAISYAREAIHMLGSCKSKLQSLERPEQLAEQKNGTTYDGSASTARLKKYYSRQLEAARFAAFYYFLNAHYQLTSTSQETTPEQRGTSRAAMEARNAATQWREAVDPKSTDQDQQKAHETAKKQFKLAQGYAKQIEQ